MKVISRHRHCEQRTVGGELVPVPMVAIGIRLLPGPLLRLRTHLPPAYQHCDNVVVLCSHLERSLLGMEHHIVLHSLTGPALEAGGELVQKVVCDEWYQAKISCRITWEVARNILLALASVGGLFRKKPLLGPAAKVPFP